MTPSSSGDRGEHGHGAAEPGAGLVPLAVSLRGGADRVETVHWGAIAVVDGDGSLVAAAGDPDRAYPLRSCAKPFQLLPYVLDRLHRGDELADLAVMMSSHPGARMHVQRIASLLERHRLDPAGLLCGAHPPYDEAARDRLVRAGEAPSALHSNCSGKHTAMLAVCAHRGWDLPTYLDRSHPLQRRIHDLVRALGRAREDVLPHSIDGCSLPTWWLPLRGLATLFAALASPDTAADAPEEGVADALSLLHRAGAEAPDLVAGPGQLDTELMTALRGLCFSKTGAAGLQALAVRPTRAHPRGLGIGFKIADGDETGRVRPVVAIGILAHLSVLDDAGLDRGRSEAIARPVIRNVRGLEVGRYEPVPALDDGRAGA